MGRNPGGKGHGRRESLESERFRVECGARSQGSEVRVIAVRGEKVQGQPLLQNRSLSQIKITVFVDVAQWWNP